MSAKRYVKDTAMMRCTLSFVLSVIAIICTAEAAPLKLASGGKALFRIALAEEQNKFDKFAADDLASYLGRMAGAEFQVVQEAELPNGASAIYIGQTRKAAKLGLDAGEFGREEWCIKCPDDKSLVITGGLPVGAFYGAWAVLNHLGCYALTWDQDAIPNNPELTYDGFEERRKPAFDGRMIYDRQAGFVVSMTTNKGLLDIYYKWILRNYINGRQNNSAMPYHLNGVFNIPHYPQYHSMESYLPADKYFKEHPEFYWMTESGLRQPPPRPNYNGGLCLSNPDVIRLVTARLLEMIREDRAKLPKAEWPYVYDISKLDGAKYYCKCPECLKIVEAEGSQQCLLYNFLNKVLAAVVKEYPEIVIRTFAYNNESDKPNRSKPADNILLWAGDNYRNSDCFRPLTHPINDGAREELNKLLKDGKRFMIWDYWNLGGVHYFTPPRVETVFDAIQPDLQYFRQIGATDMFIEASLDSAAPQNFMALNYFVANQLMVDPERDPEKLADVFIRHYYGPNAPLMLRWFNEIRAGVSAETKRQPSSGASPWKYCDAEFLLKSYLALKEAAHKLPEGDIYRRRTEYEMIVPIWVAFTDRKHFAPEFIEAGIDFDSLEKELTGYVKSFMMRYGCGEKRIQRLFETEFEDRFNRLVFKSVIPDKFKDIPEENISIVNYFDFILKPNYGAGIVTDKETASGRAFCGAHPFDDYHGPTKVIASSGEHQFKTTYFEAAGAKLLIEEVPQDEKYHWYKMNGKAVFKEKSCCFWGQGWAIHANLNSRFDMENPKNNIWDEAWLRIKFTGPAYVPSSTKKNAMFIDQVVFIRK